MSCGVGMMRVRSWSILDIADWHGVLLPHTQARSVTHAHEPHLGLCALQHADELLVIQDVPSGIGQLSQQGVLKPLKQRLVLTHLLQISV